MDENVFVYDEHRLPVVEICLSDGRLQCVRKDESSLSANLKQFVDQMAEAGVPFRGGEAQEDCVCETEVQVALGSPGFVGALRDAINRNTFAGRRVVATSRRLETQTVGFTGVKDFHVSTRTDEPYLAIMRPIGPVDGFVGDVMIDIANCRLPEGTRYATICGENFVGYGVRHQNFEKRFPATGCTRANTNNVGTLCA